MALFVVGQYFQTEHKFVFFDPCSDKVLELDYQVWKPVSDTEVEVKAGQGVDLEKDSYYQLSTHLKSEHNGWIATFDFNIYTQHQQNKYVDTLYLHQLRSMWNGLLHPQEVEFYFCNSRCDGVIEEVDSNGVIRAKGKFKKGIPASNIKFFDKKGNLESKWIYKNGNLKKIE
jgi:hypothetical protein